MSAVFGFNSSIAARNVEGARCAYRIVVVIVAWPMSICTAVTRYEMVTAGIDALGPAAVIRILREIAAFTEFAGDNDPHGERDCARLKVDDLSILWKIDYFDRSLDHHSPDPSDPAVTHRVLTVMLASEY